jgi:hypothetical protein
MKKILMNAFYFSAIGIVVTIFLSVGASNIISSFFVQKMTTNNSITLSIMDIVSVTAQISYVLSVVLLLIKKVRPAYFVGLLAIILSSFNMIVGSMMVQNINSDYIAIISTITIGFALYLSILYFDRKRQQLQISEIAQADDKNKKRIKNGYKI